MIYISLSLMTCALIIILMRADLLKNSLVSSITFALVYYLGFNVWILLEPSAISWWNHKNTVLLIQGYMPIEEIVFALAFGALIGPLFEFLTDAKDIKNSK